MSNNKRDQSLVTERDIDPDYGMFGANRDTMADPVPDAEERLEEMYPADQVLAGAEAAPGPANGAGTEFPDVPDADALAEDSPVDPAAPEDEFHGTDLLNGVGHEPEDEDEGI